MQHAVRAEVERGAVVARPGAPATGLDYPGVGPEHAFWLDSGRVTYRQVGDDAALEGFRLLARTEGILPALEPAHALAWLTEAVAGGEVVPGSLVVLALSGRGDKDVDTVASLVDGVDPDADGRSGGSSGGAAREGGAGA